MIIIIVSLATRTYVNINVHCLQVTGDADSDGDQPEIDPSTNKPVFLVPTDSPGRRLDSIINIHAKNPQNIILLITQCR